MEIFPLGLDKINPPVPLPLMVPLIMTPLPCVKDSVLVVFPGDGGPPRQV